MFGFPKRNNIENERISLLIAEFRDGRYSYASALIDSFIDGGKKLQKEIAGVFRETLSGISLKQWYKLCHGGNGSVYIYPPVYPPGVDIKKDLAGFTMKRSSYPHLSDEEFCAVLCIGTFHYNGYFRETCLRALAPAEGFLRYFFVRANDWVEEIRECSVLLLTEKLRSCGLYDILRDIPVFERIYLSGRRSDKQISALLNIICNRIKPELSTDHLRELIKEEPAVRASLYRLCQKRDLLSNELLEYLIDKEPFGVYSERLLIHKITRYGCDEDEYEKFIHHKCPNIRYHALLQKYERLNNTWDGLEELLTDRSFRVRSLAVFILQKYESFDPREFYLDLLKNGNVTALTDISNYGKKEDAEVVKEYLDSDSRATVRKALRTYGNLMGNDGEGIYWRFISSGDIFLCKEAYRLIADSRIYYGAERIWSEYRKHFYEPVSEYLLLLLVREPDCDIIMYLLKLYTDDALDAAQHKIIEKQLSDNVFSLMGISAEKADEAAAFIEKNRTKFNNKGLVRKLLFEISYAKKYAGNDKK